MELAAASGGESIKVFVRVRPPDPHLESDLDRSACLNVNSQVSVTVHCKPEPKVFTFDHVAGMETTQEEVFLSVGRPIIDSCMRGYNGTIFAYGQTGSGKTFTMIGPSDDSNNFTHELRGIIPRSFEYLFSLINREKQKFGELVEFLCKCSFLEIYNEQVYDLIDPASCGLHLRENMKHGVYVDGLLETSVSSAKEAYDVLSTGWSNRRVAATSMNRESSRSHAVFTLTIESKKKEGRESVAKLKSSVLNLVDLAGSERQRDTHTAGLRLKEAGSINKSLSALGNVIMALVDIANGKSRHVHYRDSKLTFLLRDSLGGNAKTNLVANVHPSSRCFGESLSTLNFARRTKMIKNKAVVNEDTTGNVLQLQSEIRRLKQQLEKFKTGSAESPLSSVAGGISSPDDERTITELRDMLTTSMATRESVEKDRMGLLDRIESLQKLCRQKDNFLQSTKMILKFRETHIANLEKKRSSEDSDLEQDSAVGLLKQEIEQLKYMVEHHPDVTKHTRESADLKREIKRLKSMASGGSDLSKELARTHKYTLQLEKQLRHFLVKDGSTSPLTKRATTIPSQESQLEAEKLKTRCKHLNSELDKIRKTLQSEREQSHLRETKLEASLTATKKANLELERSIEALKLKNSVEKATLNDMHMNTIKSMLTPRKDLINTARSIQTTPYSPMKRADSEPVKPVVLNFNGLASMGKSDSISEAPNQFTGALRTPKVGLSRSERLKSQDSEEGMNDEPIAKDQDDLNIEGALVDEVQILQDKNGMLSQQIEDLEATILKLSNDKRALEAEVRELAKLGQSERQTATAREEECLEKISSLSSQIATLTSCNTVLDSEVVDLRVCLRSADKEIVELKSELKSQSHHQQAKIMEHLQKIGELEQMLAVQTAASDRSTEQLQCIQDEVETLREELTFKDHRISELGVALGQEKESVASLEKEVQTVLDQLASEVEKSTTLSSQLQEGSQEKEELVSMLDKNTKLKTEVEKLDSELRSQLTVHKKELENAERTISSLLTRQTSDETAMASMMTTMQELKEAASQSDSRAVLLVKELEESHTALSNSSQTIDNLNAKVADLSSKLEETLFNCERDIKRVEAEKDIILDDLDGLNEQHEQLQEAYAAQSHVFQERQSEIQLLKQDLDNKDDELARLYREQRERRASFNSHRAGQVSFSIEDKLEEIEELKEKLDRAADMIIKYETSQKEKNEELQLLKEELLVAESIRLTNEDLESKISGLECKLAVSEEQLSVSQTELQGEIERAVSRAAELESDCQLARTERDRAVTECRDIREKCLGQSKSIDALTQQITRYKSHEESLFSEKESLRSQLEALQEERSKLSKECEKLARENAVISGHQNIRQKIQYHAAVKTENNKLKEEVINLRGRLKLKSDQVSQLNKQLSEKYQFSIP